jgi:maltose O-acetyltransferase
VIGLGSVIRKSVPAGVVVIGNPQQIVKQFYPKSPDKETDSLKQADLSLTQS